MYRSKVVICGVNTSRLKVLSEEEKQALRRAKKAEKAAKAQKKAGESPAAPIGGARNDQKGAAKGNAKGVSPSAKIAKIGTTGTNGTKNGTKNGTTTTTTSNTTTTPTVPPHHSHSLPEHTTPRVAAAAVPLLLQLLLLADHLARPLRAALQPDGPRGTGGHPPALPAAGPADGQPRGLRRQPPRGVSAARDEAAAARRARAAGRERAGRNALRLLSRST